MRKLTLAVLIASLFVSFPALARKPEGGGGNGHNATDRVTGAERAAAQMSDKGQLNTNSTNAADREQGLDRAAQRMNEQGTAHQKATSHKKEKKSKKNKKKHGSGD